MALTLTEAPHQPEKPPIPVRPYHDRQLSGFNARGQSHFHGGMDIQAGWNAMKAQGVGLGLSAQQPQDGRKDMCLAVPGQVVSVYPTDGARMGKVRFGSILKEVCLEFVPEIEVGDYTIVHVGFALSKIDEETALQTLALFDSLGEPDEQGEPPADEISGGATNDGQTTTGGESFGR